MVVRDLEYHEIEPILRLGCAHPDNRNIPGGLDADYFVSRFLPLWENGAAHIFGIFSDSGEYMGHLAFFLVPDIFNGKPIAFQNHWFIPPQHRGRAGILLREYEKRARDFGCVRMQMPFQVKRQPAGFGKVFERRGYEVEEISYYKSLL